MPEIPNFYTLFTFKHSTRYQLSQSSKALKQSTNKCRYVPSSHSEYRTIPSQRRITGQRYYDFPTWTNISESFLRAVEGLDALFIFNEKQPYLVNEIQSITNKRNKSKETGRKKKYYNRGTLNEISLKFVRYTIDIG